MAYQLAWSLISHDYLQHSGGVLAAKAWKSLSWLLSM